jgi:small subunit ribosomal protein S8
MASHDTLGDFITIIRNSSRAGQSKCRAPWSRIREEITARLKECGFIADYACLAGSDGKKTLEVHMKYVDGVPGIQGITRNSRPGCRVYSGVKRIPRVLNGLGVSILTTPKGILTDTQARTHNVGGEIIARVW